MKQPANDNWFTEYEELVRALTESHRARIRSEAKRKWGLEL